MSSLDGVPGCRCNRPRIDITDKCVLCGLERLHVIPKTVSFGMTMLEPRRRTERRGVSTEHPSLFTFLRENVRWGWFWLRRGSLRNALWSFKTGVPF